MTILGNPITLGACREAGSDESPAWVYALLSTSMENGILAGSGITQLWSGALSGYSTIAEVDLPDVADVPEYAFAGMQSLQYAYLATASRIGTSAFTSCGSLESAYCPSATHVGSGAFSQCFNLSSVRLGPGCAIGDNAFASCMLLSPYDFSDAGSVGDYAFDGAAGYAAGSLVCGQLSYIGDQAYIGTYVQAVILPSVWHIGEDAFGNTPIEYVEVSGSSVATMSRAFANCTSLSEARIDANSVNDMTQAFAYCTSLARVHLMCDSVVSDMSLAFDGCDALSVVYVPGSLRSAYASAYPEYQSLFASAQ